VAKLDQVIDSGQVGCFGLSHRIGSPRNDQAEAHHRTQPRDTTHSSTTNTTTCNGLDLFLCAE
jgi:hypothetical protein